MTSLTGAEAETEGGGDVEQASNSQDELYMWRHRHHVVRRRSLHTRSQQQRQRERATAAVLQSLADFEARQAVPALDDRGGSLESPDVLADLSPSRHESPSPVYDNTDLETPVYDIVSRDSALDDPASRSDAGAVVDAEGEGMHPSSVPQDAAAPAAEPVQKDPQGEGLGRGLDVGGTSVGGEAGDGAVRPTRRRISRRRASLPRLRPPPPAALRGRPRSLALALEQLSTAVLEAAGASAPLAVPGTELNATDANSAEAMIPAADQAQVPPWPELPPSETTVPWGFAGLSLGARAAESEEYSELVLNGFSPSVYGEGGSALSASVMSTTPPSPAGSVANSMAVERYDSPLSEGEGDSVGDGGGPFPPGAPLLPDGDDPPWMLADCDCQKAAQLLFAADRAGIWTRGREEGQQSAVQSQAAEGLWPLCQISQVLEGKRQPEQPQTVPLLGQLQPEQLQPAQPEQPEQQPPESQQRPREEHEPREKQLPGQPAMLPQSPPKGSTAATLAVPSLDRGGNQTAGSFLVFPQADAADGTQRFSLVVLESRHSATCWRIAADRDGRVSIAADRDGRVSIAADRDGRVSIGEAAVPRVDEATPPSEVFNSLTELVARFSDTSKDPVSVKGVCGDKYPLDITLYFCPNLSSSCPTSSFFRVRVMVSVTTCPLVPTCAVVYPPSLTPPLPPPLGFAPTQPQLLLLHGIPTVPEVDAVILNHS